jgi:P4 family phage/plasmid primase-like protien
MGYEVYHGELSPERGKGNGMHRVAGGKALIDPAEIRHALRILAAPGQVIELRVLGASTQASPRYSSQLSGYFNDAERLIAALAALRSAKGVYITLQPCQHALLARAQNRLRSADEMKKSSSTSDQHILAYRWLLIDVDPDRPADISSSNEEHQAALVRARQIQQALVQEGWPEPIGADSGNGAHLLYPVDLPVTASELVKHVLTSVAERFGQDGLRIDQTVYNPSRIVKLYGTLACKGDNTEERPHRMSRILSVPVSLTAVSKELLEAIATPVTLSTAPGTTHEQGPKQSFDLATWIRERQLDVTGPLPWQGGQKWVFKTCPWNTEHTDRSAFIVQHANGAIAAGCQHNGCRGRSWRDLRTLYEPDAYTTRQQQRRTVIQFRHTHALRVSTAEDNQDALPILHDERMPQLPETDLEFVLECLEAEEEGDGRLYAHLFQGKCIYDHTEGAWYEWRGNYWERDECKHALLLASGPLASVYLAASAELSEQASRATTSMELSGMSDETYQQKDRYKWLQATTSSLIGRARALKKLKRAQSVLTYAQAYLSITSQQWDTYPWLLGTRDGVLDLCTGALRAGRPGDYVRTIIPARWKGLHEPAPRFQQYLREIFADRVEAERDELIAFLQRALGYGIAGKVNEHIFLMLYGEEGRNGKDTLMTVLHRVLGSTVGAVSNDVIIANGKYPTPGSAKPHLCALQGKRIAWASETDKGARFDVGQVKFLTGGGDIPARQLYGRDYTFAPSHLLVLLTNNKPHADAKDSAFWDRLCPVTFNLRFVDSAAAPNERKRDTTLGQALEAEASGILAWLVRGCLEWQHTGLRIPAAVLQARKAYREEEDTLGQFIQECCVLTELAKAKSGQLYERYREWCQENGLKAMTGTAFGLEMKKMFRSDRETRGYHYYGIGIRDDAMNPSAQGFIDHKATREANGTTLATGSNEPFSVKSPYVIDQKMQIEKFPKKGSWGSLAHQQKIDVNAPVEGNNSIFQEATKGSLGVHSSRRQDLDYVETPDGLGYRTGGVQEQDVTFIVPERKERLSYKVGVVSLVDGIERFYYPSLVSAARPEAIQAYEQAQAGEECEG